MPKGYVIGRATVTNPTAWAEYAAKASEAMKKYGGNPIVRGGKAETVEGQGVARNVVIEFASFEAAHAYAHSIKPLLLKRFPSATADELMAAHAYAYSAEYAAAKKLRQGAGTLDLVIVEGAP